MNSSHPRGFAGDASALERDLREAIRGEVRFDSASRALYATDSSNYRQVPIGVVVPRDAEDIVRTVELARRHGAPILGRGAGTSLAGQCCNVAVVIDTSKYMNRILEIDPERRIARVEPGVVLDTLRDAAEQHGLTFGPDPATHSRCTLGGMIGNNSCGVHSIMSGKTDVNVEELEILTWDGARFRVGATSADQLRQIISSGGRRAAIYEQLQSLRDHYAELIRHTDPEDPAQCLRIQPRAASRAERISRCTSAGGDGVDLCPGARSHAQADSEPTRPAPGRARL